MKLRLLVFLTAFNLVKILAQNLTSPQATAMSGFSVFTNSALSFVLNPAGLTKIYDWNIGLTGYYQSNAGTKMLSFGIAKRISENQSIAFMYSPGSKIELLFPSNITIKSGDLILNVEFDKKIDFSSNYGLGWALRLNDKLKIGISSNYINQTFSETRYNIQPTDSLPHISIGTLEYKSAILRTKLALLYEIDKKLTLGVSFENFDMKLNDEIPEEFKEYKLKNEPKVKLSSGLKTENFKLGFEISSQTELLTGFEFVPVENLFLRSGFYTNLKNFSTFSIGAGFKTGMFQFDIAYFKNLSKIWNDNKLTQDEFAQNPIKDVEFNPFIKDRLSLSVSIDGAGWYEKSLRIKEVEIEDEIFPHLIGQFEKRKIGYIEIENISRKKINAKVDFELSSYIDIEAEPDEFSIKPGETKRIAILVSPGAGKFENPERSKVDIKLKIIATKQIPDEVKKFKISLRGKNDWNGKVEDLIFFVKFDSPEITSFARKVIWEKKDTIEKVEPILKKFYQAKFLFDELSKQIIYVSDPSLSIDKVQYPDETLKLHTGDCDDLVVLYASLLGSVGIDVAFVDVKAMRKSDESHVYILFDSGIEPKFANLITENEKKYVVLKNKHGLETVWIPIETTLVRDGFEKAWEIGADEFFNDFEVNLGYAKGKARIILIQK